MQQTSSKTAILLFTRSASDEIAHKSFAKGRRKKDLRIVKELIARAKKVACRTGLPTYASNRQVQSGASFGVRLSDEMERLFDRGYHNLIVIGNDCPQLSHRNILQAKKSLEQGSVVLGPSKDGGIYLLGIQRRHFHRKEFIDLGWESDGLYLDLSSYALQYSYQQDLLPTLSDVDDVSSLRNVLSLLSFSNRFRRIVTDILSATSIIRVWSIKLTARLCSKGYYLRGPPFVFS